MRYLLLFTCLIPLGAFSQTSDLQITDIRQLDTVVFPNNYNTLFIYSTDSALNRVHFTARINRFGNINTVYYQGQKVIIEADTDVHYIPGTKFYSQDGKPRELFIDQSAINKLTWLKVSENVQLRSNGYRTKPISLQFEAIAGTPNPALPPVYMDSLFWGNGYFYRFEIFPNSDWLFTRPLNQVVLHPGHQYIPIPGLNYSQFRSYETTLYSEKLNTKFIFQVISNSLKASNYDIHHIEADDRNLTIGFVDRSPVYLELLNRESEEFDMQLLDTFRPNIILTNIMPAKELWQFMAAQQNSQVIAEVWAPVTKRNIKKLGRSSSNYMLFILFPIDYKKSGSETMAYATKKQEKYNAYMKRRILRMCKLMW